MSGLTVNDLVVDHGAITAINGISFTVEPGQLAAVIGSNGAGKTTLLRTLSGLKQASSGSAQWSGEYILGKKHVLSYFYIIIILAANVTSILPGKGTIGAYRDLI